MKLTDKAVKHDLLRLADDLLDVIKAELTLWESGDSNKNSNLGESFAHLGDLYKNADRFADAEVWYSLARTHYTQNVGLTAIPTLAVLSELARTYSAQGRYEEALTVGSLALTGFIGAVGPDDMRVCIIQETLGKAYQHLDHPEKAEDMYTEALEGYRGSLRPSHCLTVECLDKLVGFYIGLGRNGDGRRVLERQLADCRAVFTLESVSVTRKIKDLSQMYLGGKDGSAGFHDIDIDKKLREQARSLPDEHIAAYMALHGVGACLLYEGRLDEAEEILWEAVAGHETFLGSHHYTTQRSVYYLGLLYERKGLWRVAETMWRRAIDSLSETYGYGERKLMQWVQSRLDRLRACGGESMVDGIVVEDVTEHVEGVRLGIRTSRL
jgi:tetratricopeptide (TPR) repeat protein